MSEAQIAHIIDRVPEKNARDRLRLPLIEGNGDTDLDIQLYTSCEGDVIEFIFMAKTPVLAALGCNFDKAWAVVDAELSEPQTTRGINGVSLE